MLKESLLKVPHTLKRNQQKWIPYSKKIFASLKPSQLLTDVDVLHQLSILTEFLSLLIKKLNFSSLNPLGPYQVITEL